MTGGLEERCLRQGMRVGAQRRIVLRVLNKATDHPSAEEVHQRVTRSDPGISIATVYRTLNILTEASPLSRVEFGDGRAHYERTSDGRHEHLIDTQSGRLLEFRDSTIETALREAAKRQDYRLLQYRLELVGVSEHTADSFIAERSHGRGYRTALTSTARDDLCYSGPSPRHLRDQRIHATICPVVRALRRAAWCLSDSLAGLQKSDHDLRNLKPVFL